MNKFTFFALLGCFFLVVSNAFAQPTTTCNNRVAPQVQTGVNSYSIGGTIWTPAPPMAAQGSGFTHTEYLIVLKGTCALDSARTSCDTTAGGGDVILGADSDGIFNPGTISRYGTTISANDTFGVVAVSYDLAQIRSLLDELLNNSTPVGASCCSIFPTLVGVEFCDTLTANGINGPSDINDLNDLLTIFDAFANPQLSVNNLLSYMQQINTFTNTLSTNNCGSPTDGNLICYGIDPSAYYWYVASTTVAVNEAMEGINGVSIFPNPSSEDVTLQLNMATSMDLTLNVYNALGQKVHTAALGNVDGTQTYTLAAANYSAGMYMVELTDGENSMTSKLMIR